MTENQHGQPILIIGGGPGGAALLELFLDEVLTSVVGIVDTKDDVPGIQLAKEKGIDTFTTLEEALNQVGQCLVFNMTHDEKVSEIASRQVGISSVVGGREAKLFWQMISRMRTMQEELWENQVRMQAVIHNVHEGIISINPRGIIENVNPAIRDVFGYTPEELIGQNIKVLMPEPNRSMHDTYLRNYHKTGQKHVIGQYREVVGLHKDGHEFPIEINIAEMELDGIKHFVGLTRDISDRKRAEEKITQMALFDQLTGLPNRAHFYQSLDAALAQARRINSQVALMFIDLDGFKAINDNLGHNAGDQLLQEIGQRLNHSIRESDLAVRLGGDEFTIILNNLRNLEIIPKIADKLIQVVNQPIQIYDNTCHVGASIGIAVFPDHAEDKESLITAADRAMYEAKNAGKNDFRIASPTND